MIADDLIQAIAQSLGEVAGVCGVALGGSRARGTHHEGSDVDLGVYYDADALDLSALTARARQYDDGGQADVTGPGSWGPWVDGGGWLTVDGTAVDLILRDVGRVREQCERAARGEFAFHAQPGHPFGFLDVSYAGEVASGVVLADPTDTLSTLKTLVDPYPEALRAAMVGNLWQAKMQRPGRSAGRRRQDARLSRHSHRGPRYRLTAPPRPPRFVVSGVNPRFGCPR